eukprot:scaffold803_cov310-Pinguiococcus_pyrenoidosus.AAC.31
MLKILNFLDEGTLARIATRSSFPPPQRLQHCIASGSPTECVDLVGASTKQGSRLGKALEDDCRCAASTIADRGTANRRVLLPKNVEQGADDPPATHPDGVPKCDRATVHVHSIGIETQQLHVRQRHHRERFIDLVVLDVRERDACAGEGQGHGIRRGRREVDCLLGGVSEAQDPCHGLETASPCSSRAHDHGGEGAIVQGRRVRGGDGAIPFEGWPQSWDLGLIGGKHLRILLHQGRPTPALRNLDGNDLRRQQAGLDRGRSAPIGLDGKGVCGGKLELQRQPWRSNSHGGATADLAPPCESRSPPRISRHTGPCAGRCRCPRGRRAPRRPPACRCPAGTRCEPASSSAARCSWTRNRRPGPRLAAQPECAQLQT